jgi:hypothetical protein
VAKNNEGAAAVEYHYSQQAENRDTVQVQGTKINKALKKLRKLRQISSSEFATPELPERDDEPAPPQVTLPNGKAVDLRLKDALEAAEKQCRESEAPLPEETLVTPKRKSWFDWSD